MPLFKFPFILFIVMIMNSSFCFSSSELIHIDYGGRKVAYKANLATSLSVLREELLRKKQITSFDLFQTGDSDVLQNDEQDFTIKDIVQRSTIKIKPMITAKAVTTKPVSGNFMQPISWSTTTSFSDHTKDLSDKGAISTSNKTDYANLSENERKNLVSRLNLFNQYCLSRLGLDHTKMIDMKQYVDELAKDSLDDF